MISVTDYAALISAIAVLLGVIVALLQLRNLLQIRQMDLVFRFYSAFGEFSFQKEYQRVVKWKFGTFEEFDKNATPDDVAAFNAVVIFFETMGLFLKRKLSRIELLDDLLSSQIIIMWERLEAIIRGTRQKSGAPQIAEWFEYLHGEMKKRLVELGEWSPT